MKKFKGSNFTVYYNNKGNVKFVLTKNKLYYDKDLENHPSIKKLREANVSAGIAMYAVPAGMIRKAFPTQGPTSSIETYSIEKNLGPLTESMNSIMAKKGKSIIQKIKNGKPTFTATTKIKKVAPAFSLVKKALKEKLKKSTLNEALLETTADEKKLFRLITEDNPDLLLKEIKKIANKNTIDDAIYFSKYPEKLRSYIIENLKKKGKSVARFKNLYGTYHAELNKVFDEILSGNQAWKRHLVQNQIDITSNFLAYKTVTTNLTKEIVIHEIISDIDPYDLNVIQHVAYDYVNIAKAGVLTTAGIIGLLALGAFLKKKKRNN